jgi:probable F420-dependent oxidoreductase
VREVDAESGRPGGLAFGFVSTGDRRAVERLEALPIDSLWVGGHVASPNPSPEAMVQLARLSALTERVRVGTSILLLPLYPPAIVAKQIADLDRATNGRVTLGVGIGGEYPQEFRACQIPVAERGRRTDEAIPLLRQLWTGEEHTHLGRYYSMESVRIHPPPARPGGPPIVVAGRREPAMRRAALLGDGWMPYLYSARRYADSVATIRSFAETAGRDLSDFEWFVFVFVNADDDSERAREETLTFLGGTYRQGFSEMLDRVALAGTPAEVARGLREFVDAGARHFILAPASRGSALDVVLRVADDVIPRVQASV